MLTGTMSSERLDAARTRLVNRIDAPTAIGSTAAHEIMHAVDELIAAHLAGPDVEGWWRGYRDTVRAYQGAASDMGRAKRETIHRLALSLCHVGESCPWCARLREQSGELYTPDMAKRGLHLKECPIAAIALLSKPVDGDFGSDDPRVKTIRDFQRAAGEPDVKPVAGENVGAKTAEALGCANGHEWAPIGSTNDARIWCSRCNRYPEDVANVLRERVATLQGEADRAWRSEVAVRERLADAEAKLAHDVEEIDAVKWERDAIVDGLAKRLEFVAASRRNNALVSPDMATAAMHREVAGALMYEARRLRDPQTGDGDPAPRSATSARGFDDPCAKGHDWASTRLSDGREWQWCKRCQKCPEYVLEALRRILDAREGEAASDAAERVVKDLAEAIEHRRVLIDEVGELRRAHVSEPVKKIMALEDALSACTTERVEARVVLQSRRGVKHVWAETALSKTTVFDGHYATRYGGVLCLDAQLGPNAMRAYRADGTSCRVYLDALLPDGSERRKGRWTIVVTFEQSRHDPRPHPRRDLVLPPRAPDARSARVRRDHLAARRSRSAAHRRAGRPRNRLAPERGEQRRRVPGPRADRVAVQVRARQGDRAPIDVRGRAQAATGRGVQPAGDLRDHRGLETTMPEDNGARGVGVGLGDGVRGREGTDVWAAPNPGGMGAGAAAPSDARDPGPSPVAAPVDVETGRHVKLPLRHVEEAAVRHVARLKGLDALDLRGRAHVYFLDASGKAVSLASVMISWME